jgi:hypothetical protein
MSHTSFRPALALALAAVVLTYVGCSSRTDESAAPNPAPVSPSAPPQPSGPLESLAAKKFDKWPDPAGAMIISGERDNYLVPCGCTQGQLGGLLRLEELIARLKARKWSVAKIDLGSLIKSPATARGGFEESKARFDVALKALQMLGYDALALSAEDLKIGVGEAVGHFLNLGEKPKVVVANVIPAQGFETAIQKSVRTSAGRVKLGITAAVDPRALRGLRDDEKDTFLPTVVAPEQALRPILADLERNTDVQVLMVQGPPGMARNLAQQFSGFDVVIATSEGEPDAEPETLNDDKTLLISVGTKGKYVGLLGFYLDQPQRWRYQRVALDPDLDGPSEGMRKLIEEDFQRSLKDKRVVEDFPRHAAADAAEGATYIGAETCRTCHPNTFERWSTTKHARAFEDIVTDPKGKRSDHQFDAECISCHTTGFEYNSGWVSQEKTPYLKGNQCENCHGPGSKHAAAPDNAMFRTFMARKAADVDNSRFCLRCHDEDNSPEFAFSKYWPQIQHSKLDTYEDPKVHKGIGPPQAAPANK